MTNPNMMITGMCCPSSLSWGFSYQKSEAEIETENNNREVLAYLRFLGYRPMRDHRGGEYWHDIYDAEGELVCQIDGGVALKTLRRDMITWHEGRESEGAEDYNVRGSIDEGGKMTKSFKRLCACAAAKEPETQLDLFSK